MVTLGMTDLYRQVYKTACSAIKTSKDDSGLNDLMQKIFALSDKSAENMVPAEEKELMACREGCSICCRVHVPVLKPEAVAIVTYLKEHNSPSELMQLKEKMKKLCLEIRCFDEIERIFANKKCAFITDDGACAIYPVRPLMCRAVTSADREACSISFNMIALDQSIYVPMNLKHRNIYETAFKAVASALEKYGISSKSREITGGVLSEMDTL